MSLAEVFTIACFIAVVIVLFFIILLAYLGRKFKYIAAHLMCVLSLEEWKTLGCIIDEINKNGTRDDIMLSEIVYCLDLMIKNGYAESRCRTPDNPTVIEFRLKKGGGRRRRVTTTEEKSDILPSFLPEPSLA